MQKILIFGGSGGLGKQLQSERYELIKLSRAEKDLSLLVEGDWSVIERHQPDVVVNMAVMNVDSTVRKLDSTLLDQLAVNAFNATRMLQYSLEYWKQAGKPGVFIYVSSVLTKTPTPGTGVYSACKAFNEQLIRVAACESRTIRCNAVRLGYFDGGLSEKVPPDILAKVKERVPSRQLGTVESLMRTIEFIIETPYVNGSIIDIDGGIA